MIQVTIFSGRSGELRLDDTFYVTLFGGFSLTRPTVARQILARRKAQGRYRQQDYSEKTDEPAPDKAVPAALA